MRKSLVVALGVLGLVALGASWVGAVPTTGDLGPVEPGVVEYCGEPEVCDLWAGQSTDVGSVTVVRDASNLYVTYTLDYPGAEFGTLHLWVGTDIDDVPHNSQGVPVPGQFPYTYDVPAGETQHTFTVPLPTEPPPVCGDGGTVFYVVAHAEVTMPDGANETAFGGCLDGPTGNRWWYYMAYTLPCCDGGNGGGSYETAFAKGGWVWTTGKQSNPDCLPSLKLTKNRWGWAIKLCEKDTAKTYEIWAGAGLNDTDNGQLVGTATVVWNGSSVQVTYDLAAGFTMPEIHIYAGDLAPATIAPGQYGYNEYFDPQVNADTTTLPLSDANGDGCVWLVLHAVVYGEF